jgi:hypothetical protein
VANAPRASRTRSPEGLLPATSAAEEIDPRREEKTDDVSSLSSTNWIGLPSSAPAVQRDQPKQIIHRCKRDSSPLQSSTFLVYFLFWPGQAHSRKIWQKIVLKTAGRAVSGGDGIGRYRRPIPGRPRSASEARGKMATPGAISLSASRFPMPVDLDGFREFASFAEIGSSPGSRGPIRLWEKVSAAPGGRLPQAGGRHAETGRRSAWHGCEAAGLSML